MRLYVKLALPMALMTLASLALIFGLHAAKSELDGVSKSDFTYSQTLDKALFTAFSHYTKAAALARVSDDWRAINDPSLEEIRGRIEANLSLLDALAASEEIARPLREIRTIVARPGGAAPPMGLNDEAQVDVIWRELAAAVQSEVVYRHDAAINNYIELFDWALFAVAAVSLLAVGVAGVVTRAIVAPIVALARFGERLEEDNDVDPPDFSTRRDELGRLSSAITNMVRSLRSARTRAETIAYCDPVTGLLNRSGMQREFARFAEESQAAPSGGGDNATLMLVSIPRLRRIEDVFGADLSNAATQEAASRLNHLFETHVQGARGFVGHPSFTRFAAIYRQGDDPERTDQIARAISEAMLAPIALGGLALRLRPVIATANWPVDGEDVDALLGAAGLALDARAPEGTASVYCPAMRRSELQSRETEIQLRAGLEKGDFTVYYQPKSKCDVLAPVGAEALLRWRPNDPSVGPISRIIAVAEETGLIAQLDDFVLKQACATAAHWRSQGHDFRVAVNMSAMSFEADGFVDRVLMRLDEAGLAPSGLELEITETVAVASPERTARILTPLRRAGVRIALDDFGTGYSSYGALGSMPIDILKLDRTLLPKEERDRQSAAICDAAIALGRAIDAEITVEGIETPWQLEFARTRGCHNFQGFLYSRPIDRASFEALLTEATMAPGGRQSA